MLSRCGTSLTTVPIGGDTLLPPFFFSTPVDVAQRVVKWFVDGTIWKHLWITLIEAMLAFVDRLGRRRAGRLLVRAQPRIAAVFDPYVKMVNALPRVVLAPIFTLWFGLGIWSKVALGVTLVFFIVFFNVYQGVKEVSPTVLANARMLGMNDRQLMRHVYWPSALSWMFSSLHTSVGFAVVGAVVGEYLGSAAGLGYLIQQAEGVFDVAGVFAGMFVLAAFVIVIDWIVTLVENRLLVWRPGRGGDADLNQLCVSRSRLPYRVAKIVIRENVMMGNLIRNTLAAFGALALMSGAARRNRRSPWRSAARAACAICRPMLAEQLGEYKKAGVEVEIVDFKGGSQSLTAVIGGSADVVSGYFDHCVNLAAKNQALQAFVVYDRYPGFALVVGAEADRQDQVGQGPRRTRRSASARRAPRPTSS